MPLFAFYGALSPFMQPVFNANFSRKVCGIGHWGPIPNFEATKKYNYPKSKSLTTEKQLVLLADIKSNILNISLT